MLIRDVVASKGSSVVTVGPDATVLQAARTLVEHRIGAVVVTKEGYVEGILSERDVLRLAARDPSLLPSTSVADLMTKDVVVGLVDDDLAYAMAVMTNNRVRHLPVLDQGALAGIVSIGDLVNASLTDLKAENHWLRDYVQGAS